MHRWLIQITSPTMQVVMMEWYDFYWRDCRIRENAWKSSWNKWWNERFSNKQYTVVYRIEMIELSKHE
jgi:hypothetical protein